MARARIREEVVNTYLADVISSLGVSADAETIHVHGRHRPDVLFQMRGLRVVIEGKFADTPNAEGQVLEDARKRVRAGIAHIAAATVYPAELSRCAQANLPSVLAESTLRYRIVTETFEWEEWLSGDPASLMASLRRAQESLTEDDIVETTAKKLNVQLSAVAKLWMGQAGPCDRLSAILGINPPKGETQEKAGERRETAAKVSALVLANALIFQDQLASSDGRVKPLRLIEKEADVIGALSTHWRWIWQNINYVPIFQLGERVLDQLPSGPHATIPVKALLAEAKAICEQQGALRHDLMGRIYHWLLHHAKYLGTYYTATSSATLLLKLALAAEWKEDFGDPAALAEFKVGDLACGTGTLLMAAAQAFTDEYIRRRAATDRPLEAKDLSTLHRTLMENMLHGYDVLPSAVHLTASTLALLAPEIAFVKMNLFVMPMGVDHGKARLGSLDFLSGDKIETQMALDYSQVETIRTGAAMSQVMNATVPKMQLCVMNPPFVRSVGGNLLFGSLPDERGVMQKELKKRVKAVSANATAGLGGVFVALADMRLAEDGRLAFILPAALASGEAWGPTRELIANRYHLETVVASHDAERPNFSENTDLSELLFIARKRSSGQPAGRTTFISLWRNPRSIHEAMHLADRIRAAGPVARVEDAGVTSVMSNGAKLAELTTAPAVAGEGVWSGALFAQAELLRTAWHLGEGRYRSPGTLQEAAIPVCSLMELGSLGPDRKRIHEGFKVSKTDWSPFAGFWGHDSKEVLTISQSPNCKLLEWTESPRGPRYGTHLWQRAGDILLSERIRTNTHRIICAEFKDKILGNTWWSLKLNRDIIDRRRSLCLYLNSSLSILKFFSRRVTTQGAFVQMKQPAWAAMTVLDVRRLEPWQATALAAAFESVATRALAPISQLNVDPVRIEIDEALCSVLGLPSLAPVRELLAREPGLTGRMIGARPVQGAPDLPEVEDDDQAEMGL